MTIEIGGFIGLGTLMVALFAWLRSDVASLGERMSALGERIAHPAR